MTRTDPSSPLRHPATLAVLTLVAALLLGAGWWAASTALAAQRQAEVAWRGAPVMGFDLDATVHRFTPTDTGGIQQVVARDPADRDEIAAVRAHLRDEADAFAAGDFSSPAEIHGADMPGLATLAAAPQGAVQVAYAELDDGAELTFTTDRADLVDALHAWFDAQLSDHGEDAEAGTGHDAHH